MSNYVTLEELRRTASLGDLPIDVEMQRALDAAEMAIENWCRRRFWADADANQVRYYTADASTWVRIDDLVTLTTLKTDEGGDGTFETTWATGDRLLAPYNAAADDEPYTTIEVAPNGSQMFPRLRRCVEVTGKFGWPAVPEVVKQATVIQAARYLKRARSSPLGVEAVMLDGTPVRVRNRLDPDVEVMLSPLRRMAVA